MNIPTAAERQAAAQTLGINEQYLYQWLTGRRGVPPPWRVRLEQTLYVSHGISVEHFGDDARWHRVPDPAWPHPQGRPLIDVAAPVAQEVRDAA